MFEFKNKIIFNLLIKIKIILSSMNIHQQIVHHCKVYSFC